jgi:hypothetical protein
MDLWLNQVWQTVVGVEAPAAAVKTEIAGLKDIKGDALKRRASPLFSSRPHILFRKKCIAWGV